MKYFLFLAFWGCVLPVFSQVPAAVSAHFYYQPAPNPSEKQLIVLLPGSSGLNIFGDKKHYFQAAQQLNEAGFSTLLVDYKSANKSAKQKTKARPSERILWATEAALEWAKAQGHLQNGQKTSILAWSLAGEGLVVLAGDSLRLQKWGIGSLAMFYPANRSKTPLTHAYVPILVQNGTSDNITPQVEIEKTYSDIPSVKLIFYENAAHGFDVASLKNGRTVRFPPIFGKKYHMKYDENAAMAATRRLLAFLQDGR